MWYDVVWDDSLYKCSCKVMGGQCSEWGQRGDYGQCGKWGEYTECDEGGMTTHGMSCMYFSIFGKNTKGDFYIISWY